MSFFEKLYFRCLSDPGNTYDHFWMFPSLWVDKSVPVGIYMFKVNNRKIRTRYELCSKLTLKTPERRQYKIFTPWSSVSIVNFEHVIAD